VSDTPIVPPEDEVEPLASVVDETLSMEVAVEEVELVPVEPGAVQSPPAHVKGAKQVPAALHGHPSSPTGHSGPVVEVAVAAVPPDEASDEPASGTAKQAVA
jgi:hypothetical protein